MPRSDISSIPTLSVLTIAIRPKSCGASKRVKKIFETKRRTSVAPNPPTVQKAPRRRMPTDTFMAEFPVERVQVRQRWESAKQARIEVLFERQLFSCAPHGRADCYPDG